MNILCFTGNIGRDCESKYLPNGDAVVSFSVALSSGYGEKKITSWMNCSMFGKRAESVSSYLKKGTQVAISGEFCARPYTNKEGVEKISLDVRVSDLTLLGGKQPGSESEPRKESKQAPASRPSPAPKSGFDNFDDDIPFQQPYHGALWRAI